MSLRRASVAAISCGVSESSEISEEEVGDEEFVAGLLGDKCRVLFPAGLLHDGMLKFSKTLIIS